MMLGGDPLVLLLAFQALFDELLVYLYLFPIPFRYLAQVGRDL